MADLTRARVLAAQLVEALADAPPAPPADLPPIATPDALDRALSTAVPDTILWLEPTLVYPAPLTIRTARLTLASKGLTPMVRMTPDVPLPRFTGGLTIAADGVKLLALEVRHSNPAKDILVLLGAHVRVDQLRILGNPLAGAKRGIAAMANGDLTIRRCYVDDIFGPYPGQDTQAILAADMAPGLLIEDNFLAAAGETILIGGMDEQNADRMPSEITIRGNVITKRDAWQSQAILVKNTLEIKAGRKILVAGNDISQSWGGHGQTGYLLVLTVRNQSGGAPWATIEDVDIIDNHVHHGAAAINVLGRDSNHPSGTMARVRIRGNLFEDLDPMPYTGSTKLIQIDGGPDALSIVSNQFRGAPVSSAVYLLGKPASITNLAIMDNVFPPTTYGLYGSGSITAPKVAQRYDPATNAAWKYFVASGTLSGNSEAPA